MLVAFAGFGGAGKTTAIAHLARLGRGRRVYLGQASFDEILRCGLVQTPEAERRVRRELRSRFGPSVFADRCAANIEDLIRGGDCPLIDAIFNVEEYARLQKCGQDRSVLVAIEASFETRSRRLLVRDERVLTEEELRNRDETERTDLGTRAVLLAADFCISNECSLSEFHEAIDKLWRLVAN
jgi:dephospho-CoA kinase